MNERIKNKVNEQEIEDSNNVLLTLCVLIGIFLCFLVSFLAGLFFFVGPITIMTKPESVGMCLGTFFFGIAILCMLINNVFFIGTKFEDKYRNKILTTYKNGRNMIKGPQPFLLYYFSGFKFFRTMAYTSAILSKERFRLNEIFGTDDLRKDCSKTDIFVAKLIYILIGIGSFLLSMTAILYYFHKYF